LSEQEKEFLNPISPMEVADADDEQKIEEARKPKMRKSPEETTRREREEHELTHLPFRSWCPCCVAATAKHWPHKRRSERDEDEEAIPPVHMDYWFMREDGTEGSVTVINYVEKITKMHGAHVVKSKGTDNDTAERIIKSIEKMGMNNKIILRADQEPAIQAVTQAIKKLRSTETILEASKKYDSQSNGFAERAVQTVEGQVRAMLIALERRLQGKVSVFHRVMTWLLEHAADTLNKFAVASDGRTAFERVKGKRYKGEMVEFGRKVMCKIPCKPEGGLMQERWVRGVWLGKRFMSDEHLVVVEDGSVCVTSAVRLLPVSDSWDIDFINKIKGTPWDPKGQEAIDKEKGKPEVRVLPHEQRQEEIPKMRSGTTRHLRQEGVVDKVWLYG
jgi:hypothetical protein